MDQPGLPSLPGPCTVVVRPERLVLKVGSFTADLDEHGLGRVTLNGKPLRCTGFSVSTNFQGVPEVSVTYLPDAPGG